MHLIENNFEKKLLLDLPPHARDIAEEFLSEKSLGDLMRLIEVNTPDSYILNAKKVPELYWQDILKAALLAKTTYFFPNEKLSREEMLFLIKVICLSLDIPRQDIALKDIIELAKREEMYVLSGWLNELSDLLIKTTG